MSDTNAVKWLRSQGARFEVLAYEFTEIGADHAAAAVGRPLEMVCKTLIVEAVGLYGASPTCQLSARAPLSE